MFVREGEERMHAVKDETKWTRDLDPLRGSLRVHYATNDLLLLVIVRVL